MARKPKEDSIDKIIDDPPKSDPNLPEPSPSAVEIFKEMSVEDQDEVIRMIVSQGDFNRLARIIQTSDTPGAVELFLDRIGYHHFLPAVKDRK